jgi:hypothetical protein
LSQNIARTNVLFWLGQSNECSILKKYLYTYYDYKTDPGSKTTLPKQLYHHGMFKISSVFQIIFRHFCFFIESYKFDLYAYIYQGTNLIGLDKSGLSDPFVVVRVCNRTVKSHVIDQTNNPEWNTTLKITEICLYGSLRYIMHNPPEIIVDLFDKDLFVSFFCFK